MTAADITLRRARPADAGAIHALEQRLFTSDLMSLRTIRRFIASPGAQVTLACTGGEVVAVMVLLLPRLPRPARLYSIGVAAAHRGQGIATRLVKRAKQAARRHGAASLRLEVKERNHKARRLYEALGFSVVAELPEYYSDGTDGLKMATRLG